jgi:hypothetical protein
MRDFLLIKDVHAGFDELEQWAKRKRGTKLDGVAAGMVGAVYLESWPKPLARKALPYLQRAHRILPRDSMIGFDLATAYSLTGRARQALALLRDFRFRNAGRCNNFAKLWKDRRFEEIAGTPIEEAEGIFRVAQTGTIQHGKRYGLPESGYTSAVAKIGRILRKALRGRVDLDRSVPVWSVTAPVGVRGGSRYVLLELPDGSAAATARTEWIDGRHAELHQVLGGIRFPWPSRTDTFLQVLDGVGVVIEAIVLRKASGRSIVADLFARMRQRRAQVEIDGVDAMCIALRANRPILIARGLAEQLTVRGKTGRALTVRGAKRKLRER